MTSLVPFAVSADWVVCLMIRIWLMTRLSDERRLTRIILMNNSHVEAPKFNVG